MRGHLRALSKKQQRVLVGLGQKIDFSSHARPPLPRLVWSRCFMQSHCTSPNHARNKKTKAGVTEYVHAERTFVTERQFPYVECASGEARGGGGLGALIIAAP